MSPGREEPLASAQSFTIALEFEDRSLATIFYGPAESSVAKEYVEAHAGDRSAILDDYRSVALHTGRRRTTSRARSRDKGHAQQFKHLRGVLEEGDQPDPVDALSTMEVTLSALHSALTGREATK
jgi:predicted dehydrogenase